jgi:hypothetical protein
MPEYGRNVQKLIRHARTIANPTQRQIFIERIVDLMMQMSPQSKNLDDYRDKLWRHVFRIAEYNIDVAPPSGIIPKPEEEVKKPEIVPYPSTDARFKHYGNNVQKLVNKAMKMENGPIRDGFVEVIGNYMKMAYKTWNKEHYVSDEIIIDNLVNLSDGKLVLHENASLDTLSNANRKRKRTESSNGSGGGSNSDRDRDRRSNNNMNNNNASNNRRKRRNK